MAWCRWTQGFLSQQHIHKESCTDQCYLSFLKHFKISRSYIQSTINSCQLVFEYDHSLKHCPYCTFMHVLVWLFNPTREQQTLPHLYRCVKLTDHLSVYNKSLNSHVTFIISFGRTNSSTVFKHMSFICTLLFEHNILLLSYYPF